MINTGNYSIYDLMGLFRKKVVIGDTISTLLNHPNGTYMRLVYEIVETRSDGYVCRLVFQSGNYAGKYCSINFDKVQAIRFIHNDFIGLFKVVK